MRKIWPATIALICMIQAIIHANPFIPELVKRFEYSSDMRPIIEQLHKRNLSATTFVRLAAKQKVRQALDEFTVYHWEDHRKIQRIETAIKSMPQTSGPITYRCPKRLQESIPDLRRIVENPAYSWPQNVTVQYGTQSEPTTVAFPRTDGSYKFALYLPPSFLGLSPEEQAALLGHEHAHIVRHHNERIYELQTFPLKLFCTERNKSPQEALALFQNGTWSAEKASDSEALQEVCKAQEFEADWLALLHNNPRSIKTGMERILTDKEPDSEHPSNTERLAWARRIVDLLELEKQLAHKTRPV